MKFQYYQKRLRIITQEEMEKHGWEITSSMHWGGDSYYLVAGGDDGKEIILTIGESNFPNYTHLVVQANY